MNKYHALAILLLICGIIILGYSAFIGESEVIWVVIIPVFVGHGIYPFIGFLLIIAAMFVGIYGFFQAGLLELGDEYFEDRDHRYDQSPDRPRTPKGGPGTSEPIRARYPPPSSRVHGGGVVLIGPIPIIFGSDKKTAIILSILAIIIMVIAIIGIFAWLLI